MLGRDRPMWGYMKKDMKNSRFVIFDNYNTLIFLWADAKLFFL